MLRCRRVQPAMSPGRVVPAAVTSGRTSGPVRTRPPGQQRLAPQSVCSARWTGDHARDVRCGCPGGGWPPVTAISSAGRARREPRRPLLPGPAGLGALTVFSGLGARDGSRDAAGPGASGADLRAVRSRYDRCPV